MSFYLTGCETSQSARFSYLDWQWLHFTALHHLCHFPYKREPP